MKKLCTIFLVALLSAGIVGVAAATIYPNATCPDSVTLQQIQDPAFVHNPGAIPCHPASTDTIFGVRGIYTATDSVPASGFWIQTAGGGPYSGANVFTGSTNYQAAVAGTPTGGNLFYGDLLAVDGRKLEFNNMTEVTDFDNSQSSNDIVIRRISAGNALPPYKIGTLNELDWVPGWTSVNGVANQEPWEGTLVRVRTPGMICGRTVGTGVGSRSMLVTTAGGADTICADGFALTNIAALTVGSPIDSVQGILTQVTISAVPSYRILMRNVGDLFAAAPPNVIDAYPVAEHVIRVIFDRPVTPASATNPDNYSLNEVLSSIDAVSIEAGNKSVLVTVSNAAAHGASETITTSGVVSSSGLTMSGNQPRGFIYGVLSIAELQQPDTGPAGLAAAPCQDRSRYVSATGGSGARLTYTGVITGGFGNLFYMNDEAGGLRSGMPIFAPPAALIVGNKYVLSGQVQEFDGVSSSALSGLTEGVATQYIQSLGAGAAITPIMQTIAVLKDTTCDASQSRITAEDYEGMLVTVKNVRAVENRTAGQSFIIAGPLGTFAPDTMLVSNSNSAYSYAADSAHTLTVTGLLNYRTGGFPWRITPRDDEDIIDHGFLVGVDTRGTGELQLAVSPNPSRSARVSFTLPKAGEVDLGVFDVAGRRLVTLIHAPLPAGEFSKAWNGRDADGSILRSGVYFYRLKVGDQLLTTRAIKLD